MRQRPGVFGDAAAGEDSAGEKQLQDDDWKGGQHQVWRGLECHTYKFGQHLVSRREVVF